MRKQIACGILLFASLLVGTAWGQSLNDQLFAAVHAGDQAKVGVLIASGADVNAKPYSDGNTPLFWVKNKETAELLIAKGANVNAKNGRGETPLFSLITKEVAELLIAKGADVNAKDQYAETPLFQVSDKGIAELLIAKGADVNAKDQYGKTPLFGVRDKGIAELLIAKGADVNAKDQYGNTPLFDVRDKGIAELLIAKGADVNAKDQYGNTPLCYVKNKDNAELLIAKGADVNAKGKSGETPLHCAATLSQLSIALEVAKALLSHGADPTAVNKDGLTPLQMAKDPALISLFLSGTAKLAAMVQALQLHPNDEALRKSIIQLALTIKPSPAIPADANEANDRARYRATNAQSENDTLTAAKEDMKALDAAPWVANYYYNLGVILEKTEFVREALHAYHLYLVAFPDISPKDEQDVKARMAGLQLKLEDLRSQMKSRNDLFMSYAADHPIFYSAGGIRGDGFYPRDVAIRLAVNWQTSPPRYELLMYCSQYDSEKSLNRYSIDTQEPVDTDRYILFCNTRMHLVVRPEGEGFVELADSDGTDHRIRATLDQLFQMRREYWELRSPVYLNDGVNGKHFYITSPQGGPNERYAGFAMHETDCNGRLLRKDPRAVPDDFVTREAFKSKGMSGLKFEETDTNHACSNYFRDKTGYSWLGGDSR